MKKYKLLRDLPTFKAGETFHFDWKGNLCADDSQGYPELVAYAKSTLEKYPNILGEWFEETEDDGKGKRWRAEYSGKFWYIDYDGEIGWHNDLCTELNDREYELGNYFKTKKEAEAARDWIKSTLDHFHQFVEDCPWVRGEDDKE